ncbi:hypothetical protein UK15_21520 [Streptomyces variegatus]|uniref:Uncharacterized protein n=1 Tax=Streptomyces variegatus TaxID=284040 RepID=A0A0M2GPU1_9ACTN|nr:MULTISPECIES: hypothetical protein [Streptomyces]KJK37333.1 hypothetical protein UK15_21520 [Streptomyces variegatus]
MGAPAAALPETAVASLSRVTAEDCVSTMYRILREHDGKRVFCHLYSIIDMYSRYTVVWMVAVRADVLTAVYQRDPERFVNKPPTSPIIPTNVWINQPDDLAAAQ